MFRSLRKVAINSSHICRSFSSPFATVSRNTKIEKILFNSGPLDFKDIKLVTFDVTGTLFNFAAPIGRLYAHAVADLGIGTDPNKLNAAFPVALRENLIRYPLFGRDTMTTRDWWKHTVLKTFQLAGYDLSPIMRDIVFDKIYSLFGSPEAYSVVEAAHDTIQILRDHGIIVGIVTNSDERYQDSILPMLGLDFDFAICSRGVGVPKPSTLLFSHAFDAANELYMSKMRYELGIATPPTEEESLGLGKSNAMGNADIPQLTPNQCVHIGNDYSKDIRPAGDCGWNAIFVSNMPITEELTGLGLPSKKAYRCGEMVDVFHWIAESLGVELEAPEEHEQL